MKRSLFILGLALAFAQGGDGQTPGAARFLPADAEIAGWISAGTPEIYESDGLFGYINGGSEIFLQYDFRRLDLGRYEKRDEAGSKEIAVELYRMGSDLDAFGIFSVRREAAAKALDLGFPNWVSETQASFAAGLYYVNFVGFETNEEDLVLFARSLARKITGAGEKPFSWSGRPGPWDDLPEEGLRTQSIRYLKGNLAAQAESEILAPDFWGFAGGATAASAEYGPDGRRLVVVELLVDAAGIAERVRGVFGEYLAGVGFENGVLKGRDGQGRVYLFAGRGRRAVLVFGKSDAAPALSLLSASLGKIPAL